LFIIVHYYPAQVFINRIELKLSTLKKFIEDFLQQAAGSFNMERTMNVKAISALSKPRRAIVATMAVRRFVWLPATYSR
jgi:hypothetical protein